MKINQALKLCVSCVCVLAISASSQAAPNAFTNTAGGSWEDAANWSSGTTPINTDAIFITNAGTYTVYVTNSTADTDPGVGGWMTVSNLVVNTTNSLATLVIDFTNTTKVLSVGTNNAAFGATTVGDASGHFGALALSNGTFSTRSLRVANANGSAGTLIVAGGILDIRGPVGGINGLTVGGGGNTHSLATGMVFLTGGQILVTNSNQSVVIGNGGKGFFTQEGGLFLGRQVSIGVFNGGVGSLIVSGGTNVAFAPTTGGDSYRLGTATGRGTILLNGGALIATNGNVNLGISSSGQGFLVQSNGTFIAERSVLIGTNAGTRGEWQIFGAGSAATVKGPMFIGGIASTTTGIVSVVGSPALDWRSNINVQAGGRLLFSNYVGNIGSGGVVTNLGRIDVVNSKVTYGKAFVIGGAYVSDPSTNIFSSNVTATASGYLQGGVGDMFQFERNFINQSTNLGLFDLLSSSVLFTNGSGQHVVDLTGSYAFDNGAGYSGIADVQSNFAFGSLTLSAVDSLMLTGFPIHALYVGALDFGGLANTNNLTLDINMYYDASLAANSYLEGATYDLAGEGMLIPFAGAVIPEPGSLALLSLGATIVVLARNRRQKTQPTNASKTH